MFDSLSDRLGGVFETLTKRGALKEPDIDKALDEVRIALLEADVSLDVVKEFVANVRVHAIGEKVIRSVTPGQMVIKIVHDELVKTLGTDNTSININSTPPCAILLLGLQGSGKTTSSAKLALRLTKREKKRVLLVSLDIYRPAAQQQLATLGQQNELEVLPAILGEQPVAIAKRAMDTARLAGIDVVILDTAGRLHIDTTLMAEISLIKETTKPTETLLVADSLTGQDAVNIAKEFNDKVRISGIILTRVDGDARGGAALSMRHVTGAPIKFIGTGEKASALEEFQAERIANSILGMGDIVGLVEKASETINEEEAAQLTKKMLKGRFTLNDMSQQLAQIRKMGNLEGLLGMMPGAKNIKTQMASNNINDNMIARQEAIILAMTKEERINPKLLNGSRRRRIASGSGTSVQDVNRVLKQFKQMTTMMKKAGKMGKKGLMQGIGMPSTIVPPNPFTGKFN